MARSKASVAPLVSLSSLGVSRGPMAPSSGTWSLAPGDVRDTVGQTGRSVQNLPQPVSELAVLESRVLPTPLEKLVRHTMNRSFNCFSTLLGVWGHRMP